MLSDLPKVTSLQDQKSMSLGFINLVRGANLYCCCNKFSQRNQFLIFLHIKQKFGFGDYHSCLLSEFQISFNSLKNGLCKWHEW